MFTLEIYNKDAGKIYTQVWRDNMYKKEPVSYKTKGFPKTVEDGKMVILWLNLSLILRDLE